MSRPVWKSPKNRVPYGCYCLYCYAPMEKTRAASEHCPACDKQVLRVDRDDRWTLERRFTYTEGVLSLAIWLVALGVIVWSAVGDFGFGLGHIIGVPVVGGFLHVTVSKLSHRVRSARFDIMWGIAAPAFVLVGGLMVAIYNETFRLPEHAFFEEVLPWLFGGLFFTSPLLAFFAVRLLERAKARYVLRRIRNQSGFMLVDSSS